MSKLIISLARRFRLRSRRGNIAIIFALSAPMMVGAVGAAVDLGMAVQFKTTLQNAVDSAAIAGAAAYTDSTKASAASTQATNYISHLIPTLPANNGVTPAVSTAVGTNALNGDTQYQVTTSATANVSTTFLAMFVPSIPVKASATAAYVTLGGRVSVPYINNNAGDRNTIYWYVVKGSTPPTFNAANFPKGTYSDTTFTAIFTNDTSNQPPWQKAFNNGTTSTIDFPLPPGGVQIGFALVNTTGALASYGSNQYGGTQGSTHVFYSQLTIPNSASTSPGGYTNAAKYTNANTHCGNNNYSQTGCGKIENCSLQTQAITDLNNPPTPATNKCFTTAQTNAAPTCAQLGGKFYYYSWNDMGGTTDDFDYNDAQFAFSCTGGAGGSGTKEGVVLIN